MKILLISPYFPFPTNMGGSVRITEIFKGLSRFHDVTLVAPSTNINDLAFIPDDFLKRYSFRFIHSRKNSKLEAAKLIFSGKPYHYHLWYSPLVKKGINAIVKKEKFDFVYCNFIFSLPYIYSLGIPIIVDTHNVDSLFALRKVEYYRNTNQKVKEWVASIGHRNVVKFEKEYLKYVKAIVSVSKKDVEYYKELELENKPAILMAPNGVDTIKYRPVIGDLQNDNKEITIGFIGSLDLELNQSASLVLCQNIIPKLNKCLPNKSISVLIIGRNPPKGFLKKLSSGIPNRIDLPGTVPEITPFLQKCNFLVLPLQGGAGTKLRVLEAMATGIPIIGSNMVFWGMEEFQPNIHYLQANDVNEFVEKSVILANDRELAKQISKNAYEIVKELFTWNSISTKLSNEIDNLFWTGG